MVARGDLVRVGPAYRMACFGLPARLEPDGAEGIYTVVGVTAAPDALLVRGDQRADLPDQGEWEQSISFRRCEKLD